VSDREPTGRYLSPAEAKLFYDCLGARQDWQGFFENPAIKEMVAHAAFDSAHWVFEFGCGTGALASRLLQHHLPADARYVGFDISRYDGLACAEAAQAVDGTHTRLSE
jgi:trans-aconitate methyltransferase